MTISQLTKKMDGLGRTWEEFKSINDRRLEEIEKKGSADALTMEQLGRMNSSIDSQKSRISSLETAYLRPGASKSFDQPYNNAVMEYKDAFNQYIRRGTEDDLAYFEKKALSVGSDPDGGYMVTPQISNKIVETVFETSPMRQLSSVETISSDVLEIIEDNDEAAAGWTASETSVVTETATPTVGKKVIAAHELVAQPKATQKLIDDSSIDIESWLSGKLTDVFVRKENTAFISGTGTGQPTGILTYAAGTAWGQVEQVNTGVDASITADSLIDLFFSLKEEYVAHATFLMNRATAQQVRLLKDANGQYLWNPGLSSSSPDTLLGLPVKQAADMPSPASGSLSIALADFKRAYQIVDRTGVRILRDPYTEKPFVKFYATKRVGGDVTNFEAIKLLNLAV